MQLSSKVRNVLLWTFVLTVIATGPANAEGWDWRVSPYAWAAGVDGDAAVGPVAVDVDVKFSDILKVIDFAAFLRVAGQTGQNVFYGEVVYVDTGPDVEGLNGEEGSGDLKQTVFDLGYLRRFPAENGYQAIGAGIRLWDVEVGLDLPLLPAIERGDDWMDGFIAGQFSRKINDKWDYVASADIGTGDSDLTYSASLIFTRQANDSNRFLIGYKALGVDYETNTRRGVPFKQDLVTHGLVIGYMFD